MFSNLAGYCLLSTCMVLYSPVAKRPLFRSNAVGQ
jgi:hypothetical protein